MGYFLRVLRIELIGLAFLAGVSLAAYAPVPTSPIVTITNLPTCNATTTGQGYIVTDALLPAIGSAVANGGVVKTTVHCVNGTGWIVP